MRKHELFDLDSAFKRLEKNAKLNNISIAEMLAYTVNSYLLDDEVYLDNSVTLKEAKDEN